MKALKWIFPRNPLLAIVLLLGNASAVAETIRVFAAASLTDSLRQVAAAYTVQARANQLVFNFAASSTLARQIIEGAPADIFFSADEAQMDLVEGKGLVVKDSRRDRLGNSLVIIVAARDGAAIQAPEDLTRSDIRRITLADPKAVPAGVYAKTYLEGLGLWTQIKPKVVAVENVRAAMAAVESGDADASIVYRTDAAISKKIRIGVDVPIEKGPQVRYPMALVAGSERSNAAADFFQFLRGKEAAAIFRKFGFAVF
ncbi:MAG TPA: molybdate ABC transporter substrate-binding protein [Verrucomicrobiae bacterium]|nr:molybdate ABC transporter substrate-binding protein [Verrucomicrobiae bacterium]